MSDLPQALQVAAGRWLEPLAAASRDSSYRRDLFVALGLDADGFDDNGVARLATELGKAADALDALVEIDLEEPSLETVAVVLETARSGVAAAQAAAAVAADLDDAVGDALAVLERLFGLLTVGYLASYAPAAYDVATLLTLIRSEKRPDGELPRLELARLPAIIDDPGLLAREYLGSDGLGSLQTAADAVGAADRLLPRVAAVARHAGVNARYSRDIRLPLPTDPGVADRRLTLELPLDAGVGAGLILSVRSAQEGGAGFVIAPFGAVRVDREGLGWTFSFDLEGTVRGLAVGRDGVEFPTGTPVPRIEARAAAVKLQGPGGVAFRTSATGNRLEIGRLGVRAGAVFASDYEIEALFEMREAVLVIAGGDGLLEQILPPDGLRVEFDLGVGWSRRKGLFFAGGASLDAVLGLHRAFGPLRIELIHLSARAGESGLTGTVATTAALTLGPVLVELARTGVTATVGFPRGGGNLGPVDLQLNFKAPDGAALSIDAGAVTGGGYLFFDPERGRYAGALQLEFKGIALKAFGVIDTRMPDGSEGFSLVVIISAEFTPIQLGFGFTLMGVGGLLGVNRTVAVEVLRAGIKSGTLESVLFPKDPVANATQIVGNLSAVFPPAPERHVFGPMARLGWGTPTLLTIDLGLVIELPAPVRLVILGRLRMALPSEQAAIVRINVDVLGVIDFDRGEASVDAGLYDSTLAGFALTGDMAMRANWLDRPGFALSVGGFNPRFQPPPAFPVLRRLAISLTTGDNPRLRLEAYLALTSNTAQVGARLEVYAAAAGFSVEGTLYFDALFQFDPFAFIADMGGSVALKRGNRVLMGVSLDLTLSGPTPWHARGTARFQILFLSATVSFDTRFGSEELPQQPEPVNVGELLDAALRDPRSWSAQQPRDGESLFTLSELAPAPSELLVHPLGGLAVTQRVAPLGIEMTRYGGARIAGESKFAITQMRFGASAVSGAEPTREHFAPAQFLDLSDDEKLSRPSFECFEAGRRAEALGFGRDRSRLAESRLHYETHIVDAPDALPRLVPEPASMAAETLALRARTGPAALAETRSRGPGSFAAPGVELDVGDTRYAAFGADGPARDGAPAERPATTVAPTYTEAVQALEDALGATAHGRADLAVVPAAALLG